MISTLEDIPKILADRELFEKTVYTPLPEALEELKKRRIDKSLEKQVLEILNNNIPEPLKDSPKAVIFRQLITPNYEVRRFVSIIDGLGGIGPLFWEYHDDKFTSNNEWKHSLGKMKFYNGKGKKVE